MSMRAAAGTACSQTRLKSETRTTTEPGGGRGQRERNTSGRKGENVHRGERRENMQSWRGASMQKSVGEERRKWRDTDMKDEVQQGKSLRIKSKSVKKKWCGEEGVMCLGREPPREKGKGREWACSVWTDIGRRLSFSLCLTHQHTQQQWHLPQSRGQKEHGLNKRREKKRSQRKIDFCLGLSLSFPLSRATAMASSTGKTREQGFVFQTAKDYSSSNSFTPYRICFFIEASPTSAVGIVLLCCSFGKMVLGYTG